jgi:hypothetical protein
MTAAIRMKLSRFLAFQLVLSHSGAVFTVAPQRACFVFVLV